MAQFRIDATQINVLIAKMRKTQALLPIKVKEALHEAMNMTLTEQVRNKIEAHDPFTQIWTGQMWQSIKTKTFKVTQSGAVVDLTTDGIRYGAKVELGGDTSAKYEQMLDWVEGKLGLSGKEAKAAAWRITRKLNREGAEAHPFMVPTLQAQWTKLQREYYKRIAQKLLKKWTP